MDLKFQILDQRSIHDPFVNLATEEYLLEKWKSEKIQTGLIFLYRNDRSVVCGKNQSIWAESNLKFCRENEIQITKRLSGGGTVYHDLNNLNFCFITPKISSWVSNFGFINNLIIDFLRSLGADAYENERHDILIDGKKISGNAQHLSKNYLVSHATLLFSSDLSLVSNSLNHGFKEVSSKGIQSKKVPVTNILEHIPNSGLSISVFIDQLISYFKENLNTIEDFGLPDESKIRVQQMANTKYKNEDWIYGKSPDTQIRFEDKGHEIEFLLNRGKVVKAIAPTEDYDILIGKYLNYNLVKKHPELLDQMPI